VPVQAKEHLLGYIFGIRPVPQNAVRGPQHLRFPLMNQIIERPGRFARDLAHERRF
jgi:hypothetical protein